MPRAPCQADPEAGQPDRQAGRQKGGWAGGLLSRVGAGKENTDQLLESVEPGWAVPAPRRRPGYRKGLEGRDTTE